ncbi:MAG: hypothetical protein QXI58_00765 [Candidatus Micrarchaeia archaeon]
MKAIYLTPPHGELIYLGLKKIIVKKKQFKGLINQPLLLVSGNKAYGIIKLESPIKINKTLFDKLYPIHLITEEERKKWGFNFPLYLYPIEILELFEKPKKIKVPKGTQTFFNL